MEKAPSKPMLLVACKLPSGLIMELIETAVDPATGAPKGRHLMPPPVGERVVLKGSNSLAIKLAHNGVGAPAQEVHRYAVTRVEEAFCKEWFRRNAGLDCVKHGLVFIVEDQRNPKPQIREREADPQTRTGFEALALEGDPRLTKKSPRANVPNVASADLDSMAGWDRP